MIITSKFRIETNMARLNEFFELLSPSARFLQSEKLFKLISSMKNTLTGVVYNGSWDVLCNHDTRSINRYYKGFVDDYDCQFNVVQLIQPSKIMLIVPSQYDNIFESGSVFVSEPTIDLETHLFVDEQDSYIDLAYRNAEHHYAHYSMLDHMFNTLTNSVLSTKYTIPDFGDWHYDYFREEIEHYKNVMFRFGLLSKNVEIQERAKMILSATEMLYCESSYLDGHHSMIRIGSEFFSQGGKVGRDCSSIASCHTNGLRGEIRAIHNPLFTKYLKRCGAVL